MMTIREANRSDNAGLLSLTALSPMDGEISIRYDRDPDFFGLLDRRGRNIVLAAEAEGRIVGCVSAASMTVNVGGRPELVRYLGDLRVHPDYRGSVLAVRLLRALKLRLVAEDADLVVCTAAQGNQDVLQFFQGRAGLPLAQSLGVFRVLQILPARRMRLEAGITIREEEESREVLRLFNEHFRNYLFGPVFETGALEEGTLWVARSAGRLLAAVSLLDVGADRRNVIIRLPFFLRVLTSAFRVLRPVAALANLPLTSQPVKTLYLRAIASREGAQAALDLLIGRARRSAFEGGYHFLAAGVHDKDPLAAPLAKYPKFVFKSLGFVIGLKRGPGELRRLAQGVPYEDYSLV